MALFKKKKSNKNFFCAATIITEGTTSIGSFIGNDSIHIDGQVQGDVKVNNVIVLGPKGVIYGNIKAKQVISNGYIEGNIVCDVLELLETSRTKSHIKANKILVKGKLEGTITCSGLFIAAKALVEATIQAKNISTAGRLIGVVACKMLKIINTGHIKGKMFADRIINHGGQVEGFIGKYSELVASNPHLVQYAAIFNKPNETALLHHSDYYVNIQEEIQNQTTNTKEQDSAFIDVEFDIKTESNLCPVY